MRGITELVQIPKQKVPIDPTVILKKEGQIWDTYVVRYEGEELMTFYLKRIPNLIFDSKGLTKLFSIMEDIENDS